MCLSQKLFFILKFIARLFFSSSTVKETAVNKVIMNATAVDGLLHINLCIMTRDPRLSWVGWVDLCALGDPLVDNGEVLLQMRLWHL